MKIKGVQGFSVDEFPWTGGESWINAVSLDLSTSALLSALRLARLSLPRTAINLLDNIVT